MFTFSQICSILDSIPLSHPKYSQLQYSSYLVFSLFDYYTQLLASKLAHIRPILPNATSELPCIQIYANPLLKVLQWLSITDTWRPRNLTWHTKHSMWHPSTMSNSCPLLLTLCFAVYTNKPYCKSSQLPLWLRFWTIGVTSPSFSTPFLPSTYPFYPPYSSFCWRLHL